MTPQHPDDWKAKEVPAPPGLKKIAPYWYPYTTMTKMRWIGRELLEVVSTEFRDRSMEYYVRFSFLSLLLVPGFADVECFRWLI